MACISIRNKTVPPSGFSAVSPSGWLLFSFESGSSLTGNSNAFVKKKQRACGKSRRRAVFYVDSPGSVLQKQSGSHGRRKFMGILFITAEEEAEGTADASPDDGSRFLYFLNPLLNMFFNLVPDHFRGLDGGECFNGCVCHCFVLLFFYSVLLFVKVFPSFLYCFRILICRKGTGWQSICLHTIKQFIQITSVTHSAGKRRASFRKIWYNSFIKNGGIPENEIINFDGDAERRCWNDRLD